MPSLRKINVVFLFVADLERARRFYESIVGFGPPVVQTEDWVEYPLSNGTNFALHRTTPDALAGGDPTRNTLCCSFAVDDLNATFRQLTAEGVEFVRPPEQGHGFLLAEFLDPEGNQIRLIQPLEAGAAPPESPTHGPTP